MPTGYAITFFIVNVINTSIVWAILQPWVLNVGVGLYIQRLDFEIIFAIVGSNNDYYSTDSYIWLYS